MGNNMNWQRILMGLILTTFCQAGPLLAMERLPARDWSDKTARQIIITGSIVDNATLKPISGAEVSVRINADEKKEVTQADGKYRIQMSASFWFRYGTITASAKEYKKKSSSFFLLPGNRKITRDFVLSDTTKPVLEIVSPINDAEVFPNLTIELRYEDHGSGISLKSVGIFAGDKEVTRYISAIDRGKAICVIPKDDSLEGGNCRIYARVQDFAGNVSEQFAFVTVISKAKYFIRLGKKALVDRDTVNAYRYFKDALADDPNNPEANFYFGVVRLAALPLDDAVFGMLKDMGFKGVEGAALRKADLDPFCFQGQVPSGLKRFDLAPSFPTGERLQKLIKEKYIFEIDQALKNLNMALRDKDFVSYISITNPFTGTEKIEIDYGDAAFLKSVLLAIESKLYEQLVRDFDVDMFQLSRLFTTGALTPEYIIEYYPDLMRVKDIPSSLKARQALVSAIDSYNAAFSYILAEKDDQSDDLVSINQAPEYRQEAIAFARELRDLKKSLLGRPDKAFSVKFSQFINAENFFSRPVDFRRLSDKDSAQYLFQGIGMPYLNYIAANLSRVKSKYREFLPPDDAFYKVKKREVDFADVAAASSGIDAIRMTLLSASAYNLDVDIQTNALKALGGDTLNIQDILDKHPQLLNLSNSRFINLARESLNRIESGYVKTSKYLLNDEDADQSDDILSVSDYSRADVPRYGMMLEQLNRMRNTLIDPRLQTQGDEFHINPAEFFLNYKDARSFVPGFDRNNHVVPGSWPDEKFGGILPDNKFSSDD